MTALSTDKTILAIRAEGNLFDQNNDAIPSAVQKLNALADTSYIIVTSPSVDTHAGVRLLFDRLNVAGVRYDEVWASYGIPKADLYIDGEAQSL